MGASKQRKLLVCLLVCFIAVSASPVLYGQGAEPPGSTSEPPGDGGQQSVEVIHPKVRGFALQKVGSRYEPVPRYNKAFRLPGTNMRFGSYTYFMPEDEELGVPKWGFLLDNGRFFYVNELFAYADEPHYALSGNYFVVDGGSGGSGNCRAMYLFLYDKNSARLIDRIEESDEVYGPPNFGSDYPGTPSYGHEVETGLEDVLVWIISEKDRQGHPLIRLGMERDLPLTGLGPEKFEVFHIYLRIVEGRLRVALDPYLYETLFRSLGEAGGPRSRSAEYYVSGFLSKRLTLAAIKAELAGNKDRLWLVDTLRYVNRWDYALHRRYGHPLPAIVEYKLKGR